MAIEHGTSAMHHKIDQQFDSFKARIHDTVDRADATAKSTSSWLRGAASKAAATIKEHPYAAVGIAFGLGYAIVRFARGRK